MPRTDPTRFPGAASARVFARVLGLGTLLLAACRPAPRAEGVAPPEARPSPSARVRRDIAGTEKPRYSQHAEEIVIRDFFQDRRDGFFLDVGCAWPKRYSNTYYLESELGWSGIGIDALPEYAPRWKNQRPRSKFFNYLVSDRAGGKETFFRAPNLPGISSVRPRDSFSGKKVEYEEIVVPVTTLTKILDDNGVSRLDLLSMDIEGAELPALAGFDIERFRPELVCIEVYHAGREKVLQYFVDHGYEQIERYLAYDRLNYYFAPKPRPTG
jgi:FkbM family methyltransferase